MRYLDPKTNLVFKRIFGDRPHLLKSFLNAVLPLPEDNLIEALEYLPTEHVPKIAPLKYTVVNVKCSDQQGRTFIVEMQIEWSASFMSRMLFNASTAYVKQLYRGEKYELLCPVYALGIIACIFDKETPNWYHHYKLVNVIDLNKSIEGLQLVFLELPKFEPKSVADKRMMVLWLRFLAEINEKTREVSPELLACPEINEALSLAEEIGYTQAEINSYDRYWDSVQTEKSLLSDRFKEGREEGREEGRQEGLEKGRAAVLAIAKKLFEQGLPRQTIMQMTDLTEIDLDRLFNVG